MAAATTSIRQQPHPEEEEAAAASWAELPSELVYIIMDKLSSSPHLMLLDYIRFSSICTSWSFLYYNRNPTPQPPLLMVPPSLIKKKKHRTKLRRFYNVCDNTVHPTLQVSMPRYRHCRGSSHGWLITVDNHGWLFSVGHHNYIDTDDDNSLIRRFFRRDDNRIIRLFNPFLPAGINEIVLSSLGSLPFKALVNHYSQLKKVVLSANPISNPTNYTVMAIYDGSRRLAFFKPGNKVWTDVKLPVKLNEDPIYGYFEDVIYWRDEFHAIHHSGQVFVCKEVDAGAAQGGSGMEAHELGLQPLKNECKRTQLKGDEFHAIHRTGPVFVCKEVGAGAAQGGSGMEAHGFGLQPLKNECKHTQKYLVVSSDGRNLMQVHRDIEDEFDSFSSFNSTCAAAATGRTLYSTVGFRVFKLVTINHFRSLFEQERITGLQREGGAIITKAVLDNFLKQEDTTAVEMDGDVNITSADLYNLFEQQGIDAVKMEGGAIITKADLLLPTDFLFNWVEVKSLCGDTMFLGHNASISISVSNHPGCKPNCIYFTDDTDYYLASEQLGPHDMGVFNLEEGSIERHFPIDPKNTSIQPVTIWPVPIWIQPTIPKCRSNNTASTSSDEKEQ